MAIIGLLSYCTPPLAVLLVALLRQKPVAPQVLLGMTLIVAAAITGKLVLSKTRRV